MFSKLFLCSLALVSPQRPPDVVGLIRKEKVIYRDATREYCFEEVSRLGKTWVDDELLWQKEVPLEECRQ